MPALNSLCFSQNMSLQIQNTQPTNHLSTKPKALLQKLPMITTSDQFKEKVLCLELIGVNSGRALSLNPSLLIVTLDSINTIISFLQSKGIHQKDLGRIFGMCPKILTSSIKHDLLPVFQFLSRDLNVPTQNFRKAINKCPRLLVSSVRDQLKPSLLYLKRLGLKDIEALAYQDPVLLVSSVENTLIPKLDYLVELGFSRDDAVGMVVRCPGLFTFSVENNFKPKFGYFLKEMKGDLEELKGFPQYFAFSLDKRIKPRHKKVLESGVKVPLSLMLKSTNEEFNELIRWVHSKGVTKTGNGRTGEFFLVDLNYLNELLSETELHRVKSMGEPLGFDSDTVTTT
ncbi:hypothetical protein GIB67_023836 [Kingdonia uniflora]|uniref:Uncharacterized protein n=1 Tax=Kingdonia uniflora TaxID=39325 RepID=A0A7J7NG12_9MAGN|nr:hypothetical protein GIB67_023836 [Kingdonia uniflora]